MDFKNELKISLQGKKNKNENEKYFSSSKRTF